MPQGNAMDKMEKGGSGDKKDDGDYKYMTPADRKDLEEYKKWQEEHKDDLKHGYIQNRY